ncbi:uncharacterized protein LOC113791900 [Dermatophagoides pteronyssinus]|uniref:Uncharacterized protein LOC113791900 n=2 Tax=Dermatophagoides pteronyssinus TaxID=6956 RepID=A0A6P6XXC6_DERPT|nr:uncharacterized protein LOC113791900 [Dermatophagoides pteronyssinus]KAH9414721.1 hypothetical protein DERP_008561 [Dermatophagoides pteronyssinus]
MFISKLSMRIFILAIYLYGQLFIQIISCSNSQLMERLKVPPRFGKRQFDSKELYSDNDKMFTNDMIEHRLLPTMDQQRISILNTDTFQPSFICKMIRQGQYYNLQCFNSIVS